MCRAMSPSIVYAAAGDQALLHSHATMPPIRIVQSATARRLCCGTTSAGLLQKKGVPDVVHADGTGSAEEEHLGWQSLLTFFYAGPYWSDAHQLQKIFKDKII